MLNSVIRQLTGSIQDDVGAEMYPESAGAEPAEQTVEAALQPGAALGAATAPTAFAEPPLEPAQGPPIMEPATQDVT